NWDSGVVRAEVVASKPPVLTTEPLPNKTPSGADIQMLPPKFGQEPTQPSSDPMISARAVPGPVPTTRLNAIPSLPLKTNFSVSGEATLRDFHSTTARLCPAPRVTVVVLPAVEADAFTMRVASAASTAIARSSGRAAIAKPDKAVRHRSWARNFEERFSG